MKQAFFLISVLTVQSIHSAFQSVVQSRLLLYLNEIRALIQMKTPLLISDRKAKKWWKNMGSKNVRGNVKPLACECLARAVHLYTGRYFRDQLTCAMKHWEAHSALKTCLAATDKHGWIFRDFRNTLLISTVFTANNSGYRRNIQLWGWAALARYGSKLWLTTGFISSIRIYQSKETPKCQYVLKLPVLYKQ